MYGVGEIRWFGAISLHVKIPTVEHQPGIPIPHTLLLASPDFSVAAALSDDRKSELIRGETCARYSCM